VTDLVSVIIPTFNSAKTIRRALNSVIRQSYKNWEVIIIDSNSNDKTLSLVKLYKSKKIKVYQISKSKGLAAARYYGIQKSKGKLLAFLDSDDEWHNKSKLSKQVFFHTNTNIKFSCTAYNLINMKKKKMSINQNLKRFDFNYLLSNRPIALSTVMIQKKFALKKFKKYLYNEYAEDYLWWLVALKKINYCYILKQNLSNIYLADNNRSMNIVKNYKSLYKIYKNNFYLSNYSILLIFIKLILNTLNKNIFKFRSFFA